MSCVTKCDKEEGGWSFLALKCVMSFMDVTLIIEHLHLFLAVLSMQIFEL